ncbi:CU044_5270 family protein [Sphaerisporangium sp. TRM90804]|uniref:CU044_5270 family protein n=1 Tax=Sphaerisporangium sp. TRM90804 TaxID=3031113 RepID=UPI00244BE40C|nr:CU044_5270 family protein [Sphaerisporangium sp. TRM90804]MDH2430363.1 CU044_5270 family protein [Sphaerisporangium sp. TRM90804]
MDDEIRLFAEGRPAAPPYPAEAREAARRLLLDEAARPRRFRVPWMGWQAVGAFGLTVALVGGVGVALSSPPAPGPASGGNGPQSVSVAPPADVAELDPKPGQFIMVESETMYPSERYTKEGEPPIRHLYRTKRQIWKSVDGSQAGLLRIDHLEPKAFPGQPLPQEGLENEGSALHEIDGHCPSTPDSLRTDFAYLSTLPADAAGMREHLYAQEDHGKNTPDDAAWTRIGDLLRENYLPRAQREALFEAGKTIPGVEVAEGVEDAAGREGVALGRVEHGLLTQLVFAPETRDFLGERGTVVDAAVTGAPAGSVLALTAQTRVAVAGELPSAQGAGSDGSCEDLSRQQPAATPSG